MVKSGMKSATKVSDVPAVNPSSKSIKKGGKRGAEEAIEKIVSAKKQKTGLETKQAVSVKKPEVKTRKKKKEESSSSDDSSSEEDEKVNVVTKKAAKPSVEESSSDESSSDEEVPPKNTAPVKQTPATKGKVESSSDSSDDESDEEPPAKAVAPAKKQAAGLKNGIAESSSSDSSDDESEEDEKPSAKVAVPLKKAKADRSSSDDEYSSSDEDAKPSAKIAASVKKQPDTKNGPVKKAKAESSSSESSDDDDSSSDEEVPISAVAKVAPQAAGSKKAESSDSSDESDSDDDKVKVAAPKESSSDDSSDEEEESDDEKSVKTPKKNASDVEMVDASPQTAKKAPQTPATPSGSKTLFVGNLSYDVEREDVENFFKEAGEVVDVRFAVDKEDQRFKGFGHVEFATAEAAQKALKLNGKKLNGRDVRLDLARERGAPFTPQSGGNDYNSFQKGGRSQGQKVFVRGFDKDLGEDEIRESLQEHFKACGEVSRISIPTDRETGSIKGMAYLEFQDSDGFSKALELNNSEFGDNYLTVEEAKPPRSDGGRDGGFSGGRGRRGGGFGGRRGGGFGGRDGGRGGRGRGGRGFNKPSITNASSGKKTKFGDYDD